MRRLLLLPLLLCVCGCARPMHVTVHVPTADVARCPDLSGVLPLLASGTSPHPLTGLLARWSVSSTATVVAHRGDYWYAITCHHCVAHDGAILSVDGQPAEPWVENEAMDLALVRFRSGRYYPQYPVGTPTIGQTVYTAGWTSSPTDSPPDIVRSVRVRHVRRGIVSWVRQNTLGFDAGARTGFSGGPVLTPDGKLVGVNQRLYTAEGVFATAVHSRHVETLLYSLPD